MVGRYSKLSVFFNDCCLIEQEEKFAKFGAVSDVYITEKGYAFVTMDDAGEADNAVAELNGTQ
jgi:RNA recognition motif-containing protein